MAIELERILEEIKTEFKKRLQKKTSWGRTELLKEYEFAVEITLARNVDSY